MTTMTGKVTLAQLRAEAERVPIKAEYEPEFSGYTAWTDDPGGDNG